MDSKIRYAFLDQLRGLTVLSMILYHFVWDLVYIAGLSLPWYPSAASHLWQQSICWTFIFLSGFCFSFGRHPLRRGLVLCLCAAVIDLVTFYVTPASRIMFGVLCLLGSCTLFLIPLDALFSRIKGSLGLAAGMVLSFFLFLLFLPAADGHLLGLPAVLGQKALSAGIPLPRIWYRDLFTTYLGFPMKGFRSADYFPVLPWFFLFQTGYFTHKLCLRKGLLEGRLFRQDPCPPAAFLGKHSLLLYMLHQPVLYGITVGLDYFLI